MCIKLDKADYIELLEERKENYFPDNMPNKMWDYCMEQVELLPEGYEMPSPKELVDNLIINSDFGLAEEYSNRYKCETKEELDRAIKDDPEALYYDGEWVCYNFYGLPITNYFIIL